MCLFKHEYVPGGSKYFCSQFVASSLEESGVLELEKSPSLYKPGDFPMHKDLHLIYSGTLKGLAEELRTVNSELKDVK